ncbi:MAG: PorV/PorQ family protein [Elusimicrobiota bacterium]
MRIRKIILLGILALGGLRAAPARAGSAGADPLNFLFLDANARAVAMGGAYTALAADANALLYNPAGLGRIGRHEATFMHNEHFEGVSQEYMGVALRQGWGLNLNYVDSGKVPRTTISNKDGTGLGSTGLRDLAVGAGYGRAVREDLALGAGIKYVSEEIAGVKADGLALDFGALYSPPGLERLTLGLAVQNIGRKVKFQSEEENLPLNARAGAAYAFTMGGQKSLVAVDVTKERSEDVLLSAGAETVVAGMMPVRLGYSARNDAGPGLSIGLGWALKDLQMDYAFVPFGDLGSAHRLSATLRWGEGGEPARGTGGSR